MHPDRWTPAVKAREDKKLPALQRVGNAILKAAETKAPAPKKIPVSAPEPEAKPMYWAGAERTRNGLADPAVAAVTPRELYRADDKVPEPTPVFDRLKPGALSLVAGPGTALNTEAQMGSLFTAADVVNDVNTRVAQLRRWSADDPRTEDDDPVYEYTSPKGGKPYHEEDKLHYYTMPDGRVVESAELASMGATEAERQANIDSATWAYTTDPYGMLIRTAEGGESEEAQQIGKRQIGSGYETLPSGKPKVDSEGHRIPKPMNPLTGQAEPRAPWQDTSGDSAFKLGGKLGFINPDYDIRQSTINESPYWFADLNLGSAPYYIPKYNYIAGAAAALPYIAGYDGASYVPTAPGLEDLGNVGLGTYGDTELTNAQRLGGAAAPIIDAWAERAGAKPGGQMIGGLGDLVVSKLPQAAQDWLEAGAIRRTLVGGVGEGIEELASSPASQMQEEGFRNFGKDSFVNDVTGEKVYKPTDPFGRLSNVAGVAGENFMAGAVMGAPMSGTKELFDYIKSRGGRVKVVPDKPARVNPKLSEKQPKE